VASGQAGGRPKDRNVMEDGSMEEVRFDIVGSLDLANAGVIPAAVIEWHIIYD
jgi:hypothetical protein